MADLTAKEASSTTRIVGSDENFAADVIEDKDLFKKLWVKASSVPTPLGNLFFIHATNNGSNELSVNGSGNNVEFTIEAEANNDLVVSSLLFEAFDSGIRIDRFLGQNSELSNGLLVEVKSEDTVFQFLPIKNTQEFDSHFSFGAGRSFSFIVASGNDGLVSRFGPDTPFLIKQQGTYAIDDYIKVIVRDNLNNIERLQFLAQGARE